MLHTDKIIVVEGKYDAIKLANIIDGTIIRTDGFGIFHNREKQEFLRKMAEKRGLIVLTDSDSAGFLIRNFLKSIIPEQYITNVYIPDIYGKERRKEHLSAEGKLGVEGVPDDVLVSCLKRAGIGDAPVEQTKDPITRADFFEAGLTGRPNSAGKRQVLQKRAGLPSRMTGKQLLSAVNALMTRDEFLHLIAEIDGEPSECLTPDISLPKPVHAAIDMLETAGFEAYAVGGSIRDAVLGKEPNDWDITTSALPEQTEEVFDSFQTIETGIQHGTVTVLIDELPLEITTYRVDGEYTDFRHPEQVTFTRSLKEDLARRDFTMNALAYSPNRGFVDEFSGLADIARKAIRSVGEPDRRFEEDALRILRALRFSAALGFTIEPKTSGAIHTHRELISHVSEERVEKELAQLLTGEFADDVIEPYWDVLKVILPELQDTPASLFFDQTSQDLEIRMALLLAAGQAARTSEESNSILRRLRFPNRERENIGTLIDHAGETLSPEAGDIRRIIGQLGPELTWKLLEFRQALDQKDYEEIAVAVSQQLQQKHNCYTVKDLAVTGHDLITAGIPEGPRVGQMLNRLLDAVQSETLENTPEALMAFVKGDRHGNT